MMNWFEDVVVVVLVEVVTVVVVVLDVLVVPVLIVVKERCPTLSFCWTVLIGQFFEEVTASSWEGGVVVVTFSFTQSADDLLSEVLQAWSHTHFLPAASGKVK